MARIPPQKPRASAAAAKVAPKASVESPAIATLARRHAEAALAALIEVVGDRTASPAARISAASALLNWGFGKSNTAGDDGDDGPAELVIRWRNAQDASPAARPKTQPRAQPRPRQKS
jgi:hypothetical protein